MEFDTLDDDCPGSGCQGFGLRVRAYLFGEPFIVYCPRCATCYEKVREGEWRMRYDWV